MIQIRRIAFASFLALIFFSLVLGSPREINASPAESNEALSSQGKLPKFAFSPDGQILASVGRDGQITLWKVATGGKQALFSDQANVAVTGLAFSPDGQILAGIDEDLRITLWDVASGQKRLTLSSRIGSGVTNAVFSPDGRAMASVGKDPWITLWDVASGQAIQTLSAHADAVNGIAFSPDGTLLASASKDGQIKVWNMRNGQEYLGLAGTNNISVIDVAFSPDGKTLASVNEADRIVLWDVKTSQKRLTFAAPAGAGVAGMAWSPDGKTLASGGENAETILWDAVTGQKRFNLVGQPGDIIIKVAFSPDGKFLASVGQIGRIMVWDAVTGTLKQALDGQTDCVFDPNGKLLASMSREGRITLWEIVSGTPYLVARSPVLAPESASSDQPGTSEERDISAKSSTSTASSTANPAATPNEIARIPSVNGAGGASTLTNEKPRKDDRKGITALALSPDGTRIVSAGDDSKVRLLDAGTGRSLLTISGHHAAVTGIAFSADGKRLLSASRDTEVRSWDATTGILSQIFLAHEQPIRTVAASPDGGFLASAGEETRIMLWDAKLGKLGKILNGHVDFVNGLAFSPDGKLLASGGADAHILLWEAATGRLLQTLRGHSGAVNSIAFSPNTGLLASGGADSQVRLWNAATGLQVQVLQGHQGAVRAVAFSPDGQLLASAGEDTRILIWDMSTGKLSKTLPGAAVINTLVFSRDGKSLLNGGENNQITNWDVTNGQKRQTILVPPGSARAPLPDKDSQIVVNSGSSTVSGQSADIAAMPKGILSRLLDWFIPSAEAAIPTPPGGPILVINSASATFGHYYAEILRSEGFNAFAVADISTISASTLASYDVVVLAPTTLSAAQVTLFTDWVNGGGNLIAMRPDPQLASLFGITATGSTLSNAYLLVDTSKSPGNGIVNQTIQFHGTADRYTLNDASSLAALYNTATTATTNPALTLRSVGANGGQAAAFAYDLATSIVYTRQGNPAWAAQERDGFTPIRSDDKFYGNAIGDPQPDWVDLGKVAIPQADEQQRLLANLILEMNSDRKPLPRFWYFPRGKKAVVIMTGDDHGNNGTAGRFDQFKVASPAGCSVTDWECVRGTSYLYPNTPLTDAQAATYHTDGFEIGLHVNTNCADFTPASLETFYTQQINDWTTKYGSVPAPITQRHHCIAWSDWVTGAKVQLTHGIRLDTSYYFWPPGWVLNRPGFFTGSGMPMRFADLDGTLIDVYHAATQMTDESGQQYPFTIDALLDRALGVEGYYGAFTINAHTDVAQIPESDAILASAPPRGVPIVSSRQMLDWLDFRNSSSFGSLTWSGNALSFTVVPGAGSQNVPANGLQVLLPIKSPAGLLATVTLNSNPVVFTNQSIKGVDYAAFTGAPGSYVATYAADATPPTVTATSPTNGATDISQGTAVTVTFSEAVDSSTITGSTFELRNASGTLVPATVSYNAGTRTATLTPSASLASLTTYNTTVKGGAVDPRVKDLAGNALDANVAWSFTTAAQPCASAPCGAWSSSTIPGTPSVNDPNPVELGVKFRSDLDGFITGVRFYQVNAGTYRGTLWSIGGQQLATGTVTTTASGWQQVAFPAPVAITANTIYVASYHAPNGNYAADNGYFANTGVDNIPIHLLRDGVSGGNGVYAYSASSTFPTNTYQSSNYWVDVTFATSTGPDTTPPTVTAQSPVPGATGVATGTVVTAIFSEAMDATTINTTTFELRDATNALVPATVGYDGTSRTATLTPSGPLAHSATYTATLRGGTTDPRVKDLAGNALAVNLSWSFTTAPAGTQACTETTSIWPTNPTPSIITDPDTSSVEVGVKFRSTVNGFVCGIRFYKGSTNTGTHVGTLWSSTGQQLAQVTFGNETASGWQQMSFATPVAITANTVYVASYLAPVGRYSVNENYFTTGVSSGPLYALSSAESGGNGVYLYGAGGFPTNTFQASNYWVDVIFTTNTGPDTTPPTVTATSPMANATGINPANPVTATFSEAMDPATLTTSTFELRDPGGTLVTATVSYIANTATLTPGGALAASTTYTATVKGGASGAKDLAGNPLAVDQTWSFTTGVDPCSSGGNPIVCENAKPGNPSSEWDVSGAGDASIQGYATDISVNLGETVRFKISTPSTDYRLDIYRMGYYGGNGARKVATVQPSATLPQTQPNCLTNATGLMDCGNWAESASWAVPSDAISGIYFAKAVREDGANAGRASHIVFVVRNDASTSDVLFQTADTTWQAYNTYGGNSLYTGSGPGTGGSSDGRAYKVSYNRPFNTRSVDGGQDWLFNAEYPMVRWLEANGYNVSYFTGVDSDRRGNLIANHKLFLSVGHDEYWSDVQRANVESARNTGRHLAFFSGNEVFWKIRWENSIDGSGTPYRTLVCYKETHNFPNNPDPLSNVWTGTWRDPRNSPPKDGGRPENALTGTLFTVNDGATTSIEVPAEDGKMRFWRNTSIANLAAGTKATLPFGTLGYEWDEDIDNGFRPAGLIRLSTTTVNGAPVLVDYGSTFGSGTATHSLTLYKHGSGALVFGAGTVQWPWGLDSNHDRGSTAPDVSMQQATVNLFADMGVQPATLQPGLVAAMASTDTTPPNSTITAPTSGSTVQPGSLVTITGTASDAGGGVVGGVEVSVDGGTSWRRANGRASWTYAWTAPGTPGSVTIRSRAADDSGNLETPGTGITVTVGSGSDTTPPTVTMTAPADGATVTGSAVTVSANASDNVGVTSVQFLLDGAALGSADTTSPYSIAWNTATASNGAHTLSARASDAAGNTGTATTINVTVSNGGGATNTGFLAPSANAAVTASAGDNNGFQTNPANAYADDGLFAVDTNSGTNTNTVCTNTGKERHLYYNYGFSLPSGAAINGIEVRLDARADSTAGSPRMCVQLSWDGGVTWTATKTTAILTTAEATYLLGGAADTWGRTWASGEFSNANFRVRVINVASSTARDFSLDWVAVRVTYQ